MNLDSVMIKEIMTIVTTVKRTAYADIVAEPCLQRRTSPIALDTKDIQHTNGSAVNSQ